jgi:hypothetical protein
MEYMNMENNTIRSEVIDLSAIKLEDLHNQEISLDRNISGEYGEHLITAAQRLNDFVREGIITSNEAEEYAEGYRTCKNAFEVLRRTSALLSVVRLGQKLDPYVVERREENIPLDLPEDHFISLSYEEFEAERSVRRKAIENMDKNDVRAVLYTRRFTDEFISSKYYSAEIHESPRSRDFMQHWDTDKEKFQELSKVEQYKTELSIPRGIKIGVILGYHHLEKPWGRIFKEMFLGQVGFTEGSLVFIEIKNADIPTGERSESSLDEIHMATHASGITHTIDVHEQLCSASSNHYMDYSRSTDFNSSFSRGEKAPEGEYTLDPFIPLWCIEQYYNGFIYPQLQDAVNEQIKKLEMLIKSLEQS